MSCTLAFVILFLTACSATIEEDPPEQESEHAQLGYRLETLREPYASDEPITISFSLMNKTDEALGVLRWYTPLEGIAGDIFRITREDRVVEYRGPMVRRGEPRREDYVRIEPGRAVTAKVDLLKGYDLSIPGEYRVDFQGRLHDVVAADENLPRRIELHNSRVAEGDGVILRVVEK